MKKILPDKIEYLQYLGVEKCLDKSCMSIFVCFSKIHKFQILQCHKRHCNLMELSFWLFLLNHR